MTSASPQSYRGRFAHSPTGPLHLGSLVAALASFLQARHHGGAWLLRMEDLDRPRVQPGAADLILRTLESYGLHWDGPVVYQSSRDKAYAETLKRLIARGLVYPCTCTRRELSDSQVGVDGPVYPGTCRHAPPLVPQRHALRIMVNDTVIGFVDGIQGEYRQTLATDVGDFLLKRTDGFFAYQLAVVVDDAWQEITEVVRGADLLSSTPRQLYLQTLLGYAHPAYLHVPVLINAAGHKLSKQNHADPVSTERPEQVLLSCLHLLGQSLPSGFEQAGRDELLQWAVAHWNISLVPRHRQIPTPAMA